MIYIANKPLIFICIISQCSNSQEKFFVGSAINTIGFVRMWNVTEKLNTI